VLGAGCEEKRCLSRADLERLSIQVLDTATVEASQERGEDRAKQAKQPGEMKGLRRIGQLI